MHDWILFLTLTITALSLAAAGIAFRCCRKRQREKDRLLAHAAREQDRYVRELERISIEKRTLERMLETKPAAAEKKPASKTKNNL